MKFLRQYIEAMIEIDDNDWQKVTALFTKKEYHKDEILFSAGEVCQKLYYISSGVVRVYSLSTEGKDHTWMVNYNKNGYQLDPFSADIVSYLTQTESTFFIETLEDCIIYEADFVALDKLYASSLKWMTLSRNILNTQLITVVQRTQMMQRLTAKEKYLLMKQIAPIYEEVLPDYQYATVLGITPQSLSRIKNI
ncbi:MAG: Crp/Fnr family transcriptional regulator [Epsilonproteobacteria bacterium]|nr:Crp/Fnr family transcriptional regulator [Campylobacterota bacterium]MBA1421308.1 Crp/Fnr family transcriptional regulator [Campylobacterota bacterium]